MITLKYIFFSNSFELRVPIIYEGVILYQSTDISFVLFQSIGFIPIIFYTNINITKRKNEKRYQK